VSGAGLFLIARRFFFAGQFVVPGIIAQPQFAWKRFGFADTDLAAFVQKLLNKGVIGIFLWNLFHGGSLAVLRQTCHAGFRGFLARAVKYEGWFGLKPRFGRPHTRARASLGVILGPILRAVMQAARLRFAGQTAGRSLALFCL